MNAARPLMCVLATLALAAGSVQAQPPAPVKKKTPTKAQRAAKAAPVAAPLLLAAALPEQVEAANRVYVGRSDCELGQFVDVTPDPEHPSYFKVKLATQTWVVKPVLSSTGALRLEDVRGQALMLQIADKSMLMNTALGYRIADNCVHPMHREAMATRQRESIGIAGTEAAK